MLYSFSRLLQIILRGGEMSSEIAEIQTKAASSGLRAGGNEHPPAITQPETQRLNL
jgi:hypothetical protein